MFKDKTAVRKDTPIKGVRMGAGDRSYLVRDNQIDVLKNMYGGVQVQPPALACGCCTCPVSCADSSHPWILFSVLASPAQLHDAFIEHS